MSPSVHTPAEPKLGQLLAPWVVRAAALWVLVVSWIKMTKGSPGALPIIVRENGVFDEDLTFALTLSVELGVSLAALFSARVGWWLMTGLLSVFLAVLFHLISIGATNCGCFGGAITFSPYQMLAVDGTLFALLLWVRKAAGATRTPSQLLTAAALVIGAVTPWVAIDNSGGESTTPTASNTTGENAGASNPANASNPTTGANTPPPTDKPAEQPAQVAPNTPQVAPTPQPWQLPATKPRWVKLRPPEWVGKSIHETELAKWLDTRSLSDTGRWILFLQTCTHCRDYLNRVAAKFGEDPQVYVLVTLATEQDAAEGIIQQTPPHEAGSLPPDIQWVVGPELPPWELVLEGGVVIEAIHHDVNEAGLDKRKRFRLELGAVVEIPEQFQY
jgi:hypothetical protein